MPMLTLPDLSRSHNSFNIRVYISTSVTKICNKEFLCFVQLKKASGSLSSCALLGLKINPATLNSILLAAGAGSAVLSSSDSWHTTGTDFSTSTVNLGHPRYACNCWVASKRKASPLLQKIGSPGCDSRHEILII